MLCLVSFYCPRHQSSCCNIDNPCIMNVYRYVLKTRIYTIIYYTRHTFPPTFATQTRSVRITMTRMKRSFSGWHNIPIIKWRITVLRRIASICATCNNASHSYTIRCCSKWSNAGDERHNDALSCAIFALTPWPTYSSAFYTYTDMACTLPCKWPPRRR